MNKLIFGVCALFGLASPALAATVYSTDFDGTVVQGSGLVVTGPTNGALDPTSAGLWNAAGWSGNYFRNASGGNPATMSVLTISNLPAHTTMSVSFLLGFLESWDSTNGSCCSPDFLDIFIDGVDITPNDGNAATPDWLTANNALGSVEAYAGGTELFDGPNINNRVHFNTVDTLVNMGTAGALTNFAHSSSTFTLGIRASGAGWQGGSDEAWGIDSLSISFNGTFDSAVPEPATWAMMIVGFGLIGAALRRERRSSPVPA